MSSTHDLSRDTRPGLEGWPPAPTVLPSALRALALARMAVGLVFVWAFLDKLFGLHYATPSAKAWVSGGSPTRGFLSSVDVGPLQGLMHTMAGTWYADWLFMLGLLGIGLAALLGGAQRHAAVAGSVMMALMWAAEWPLAQHTSAGAASGSSNPVVDYHVVYALVLVVSALTYAGHVWGLGRQWARLPFVSRHHELI
jgi:thiosulfate dehydrogenase [quinone] large subunit